MKDAHDCICQCSVEVTGLISSIRCSLTLSLIPAMTSPGSTSICEVALCCSSQAAQLAECLPFNTKLKITQLINIHIHLAEGDTLCLTNRSSTRCSRLPLTHTHTQIGTPQVLCTQANTNTHLPAHGYTHVRACSKSCHPPQIRSQPTKGQEKMNGGDICDSVTAAPFIQRCHTRRSCFCLVLAVPVV